MKIPEQKRRQKLKYDIFGFWKMKDLAELLPHTAMTEMLHIKELLLRVIASCMDDLYVTPRFSWSFCDFR